MGDERPFTTQANPYAFQANGNEGHYARHLLNGGLMSETDIVKQIEKLTNQFHQAIATRDAFCVGFVGRAKNYQ